MKLVVFSDNHRNRDSIEWIVSTNQDADRTISLGDSEMKEHELSSLGIFGVKGNYPFEPNFPLDLIMTFDNLRFLITHGHKYFVKTGLYNLKTAMIANECDVVLFGHTHQAMIYQEDDLLFLNPGSTTSPKLLTNKSYMVIIIEDRKISVELREVYTNHLLKKHLLTLKPRRSVYGF